MLVHAALMIMVLSHRPFKQNYSGLAISSLNTSTFQKVVTPDPWSRPYHDPLYPLGFRAFKAPSRSLSGSKRGRDAPEVPPEPCFLGKSNAKEGPGSPRT